MRRVVVTGIGIWSSIGTNCNEVVDSLKAGRSGIGIDTERIDFGYRSPLTGILKRPELKKVLDRHTRAMLPEEGEYAYMAASEAFQMANINNEYLLQNEVGIIFGNDSTGKSTADVIHRMDELHDTTLLGMGSLFQTMNSTVNMNLSTIFHLRGINFTISAACSSGSHSIGIGTMLIQQGLQDIVLCGGAQEVNKTAMAAFDGIGTFSTRTDSPEQASRPFDANRDGLVPSGGAAALVLEEYQHAIARGATILAEIVGYGFSSNGGAISQPSAQGSIVAMQRALNQAHLQPSDIDYVNAHATSTPQGDKAEAQALFQLFGSQTPISSTKSMTGHECWMSGASEAVYSILMMNNSFIAPNINFTTPDEDSKKINIITHTTNKQLNYILSNSFGFGGTNSALVIKKC